MPPVLSKTTTQFANAADRLTLSQGLNPAADVSLAANNGPLQGNYNLLTIQLSGTYNCTFALKLLTLGGVWVTQPVFDGQTQQLIAGAAANIAPAANATKTYLLPIPPNTYLDAEVVLAAVTSLTQGNLTVELDASTTDAKTLSTIVNNTAASQATFTSGVNLTGASAANTVTVPSGAAVATSISDGTNTYLSVNSSTPGISFAKPATFGTSALVTGTGGLGYGAGAGGTVTQATSRTTGVTINKPTGSITLVSAAGSTTPFTFTVTNSTVAATDTVDVVQASGTDKYQVFVTAVGAGSFNITAFTTGGTTTEQPVLNFSVTKGATS
jgi:hypothetical protein